MPNRMVLTAALGCAVLAATGSVRAQMSDQAAIAGNPSPSSKTVAKSAAKAATDQDKQFVQQAALSSYTEITFSQLALQNASDPQVKSFAQRMIADHTMLNERMSPVAQAMGISAPTALDSEHQQLYDQMKGLSGAAFDKQYMSAMVTDHHKALELFKSEESTSQDKPMKPTVKEGERVIAEHTKMADKLASKLGATTTGM